MVGFLGTKSEPGIPEDLCFSIKLKWLCFVYWRTKVVIEKYLWGARRPSLCYGPVSGPHDRKTHRRQFDVFIWVLS